MLIGAVTSRSSAIIGWLVLVCVATATRPALAVPSAACAVTQDPLAPTRVIVVNLETRERCEAGITDLQRIGEVIGRLIDPAGQVEIQSLIQGLAQRHGIPPALLAAVMMAESRGDPFAVGDDGDSVGLFQLHERRLGADVLRRRNAPALSASIAARSLARGWTAGAGKGLAGDSLVRFAYGYEFNPGGDSDAQGDLVAALFRKFTGRPRALGDPDAANISMVQDAAEMHAGGHPFFVMLVRPAGAPEQGPRSLEDVTIAASDAVVVVASGVDTGFPAGRALVVLLALMAGGSVLYLVVTRRRVAPVVESAADDSPRWSPPSPLRSRPRSPDLHLAELPPIEVAVPPMMRRLFDLED